MTQDVLPKQSRQETYEEPPPSYENAMLDNPVVESAAVRDDGRVDVNFDTALVRSISRLIATPPAKRPSPAPSLSPEQPTWNVPLNVVVQVVGSRGDVQPFIALGNELQRFGHRVRLATHNVFEDFVKKSGLEFYPIGGDPADLMAYMVKNPGLIPKMDTLRGGEIQKKRAMVAEMLEGCWKSCIDPDPSTNQPFVAEAIIANPPSFAHIHCAQALSIPLHLMFTMPWSSTRSFPHPLANIRNAGTETGLGNYLSYNVVEWMTWQGLGDIINKWRKDTLNLEAVPTTEAPGMLETLKVPFTYCFSANLIPKPIDWPSHVDVCGFFFRDAPKYDAPKYIMDFLSSGPTPIYLGFGSIVIDDPKQFTETILDAVQACGVRAIISKGWSKLDYERVPSNVLFIDDCPHEWLFQQVSCVIHHGGAGTTACGLLNARPTCIIPFFGDQSFWGNMVATAGAGPNPLPYNEVSSQGLHDAIRFCLMESATEAARDISMRMRAETGVQTAVESFHRQLTRDIHRCDILPHLLANWTWTKASRTIKMSKLGAAILLEHNRIDQKDFTPYEWNPISIQNRRWDPLTASVAVTVGVNKRFVTTTKDLLTGPYDEYQRAAQAKSMNATNSSSPVNLAGAMALTTLKNFGKFNGHLFKGYMVDMPLAITEGIRAIPRLYGDPNPDHPPITDWKSGAKVAGMSFTHDIPNSFKSLIAQPPSGGILTGVGKGLMEVSTKTTSALLGLVAYPAHGFCKSLHTWTHSKTSKAIAAARLAEGEYLLHKERSSENVAEEGAYVHMALVAFENLDKLKN